MPNEDRNVLSRLAPVITVVVLLVAGSLVPKGGEMPNHRVRLAGSRKAAPERSPAAQSASTAGVQVAVGLGASASTADLGVELAVGAGPDLSAYESLGAWIDIYDEWPWAHPGAAVRELHSRGVKTIFLQTSNWGAKRSIFKPGKTARFLKSAHARDMKVVSWYVPSFAKANEDYRRSRAAIKFEHGGHRFDSFGLDIESTVLEDIALRNERLLKLSTRLRRLVGPDYTLGAITPDPVKALYWPDFPYKRVENIYDVFVPMGYFSFRTNGYKGVRKYTLASIRNIREATGNPQVPIHLIGGIGGETEVPEVKGFVRAVKTKDVLGASYYDMTVTSEEEWDELETLAEEPGPDPAPEPSPEPAETSLTVPEVRPTPLGPPASDDVVKKTKAVTKKVLKNKRDRLGKKKTSAKARDSKRSGDGKDRSRDRTKRSKRDGDGKRDGRRRDRRD